VGGGVVAEAPIINKFIRANIDSRAIVIFLKAVINKIVGSQTPPYKHQHFGNVEFIK
jgi:hypothetical protein